VKSCSKREKVPDIGASKIDVWKKDLGDGCADDFFIEEDSDDDLL